MKLSIINKLQQSKVKIALGLLILCSSLTTQAQNGTYEKKPQMGLMESFPFKKMAIR
ncbi:hypothetical protein [Pedobacter sp. P26]|uniref:hypothetical protein n=1 Tax=Pedobacter sp. P26 TaxID=3423956 RepID=UPI003D665F5C